MAKRDRILKKVKSITKKTSKDLLSKESVDSSSTETSDETLTMQQSNLSGTSVPGVAEAKTVLADRNLPSEKTPQIVSTSKLVPDSAAPPPVPNAPVASNEPVAPVEPVAQAAPTASLISETEAAKNSTSSSAKSVKPTTSTDAAIEIAIAARKRPVAPIATGVTEESEIASERPTVAMKKNDSKAAVVGGSASPSNLAATKENTSDAQPQVKAKNRRPSWSPLQSPTIEASARRGSARKTASTTNMVGGAHIYDHSYERHFTSSSPSATPRRQPSIASFSAIALNKISDDDFAKKKSAGTITPDSKRSLSRISTQVRIADDNLLLRTSSRIFDDVREGRGQYSWKKAVTVEDSSDDEDDRLEISVRGQAIEDLQTSTDLWVKDEDHTLDDIEHAITHNRPPYLLRCIDWILGLEPSNSSVALSNQGPISEEERLKKREKGQSMMDTSLILAIISAARG